MAQLKRPGSGIDPKSICIGSPPPATQGSTPSASASHDAQEKSSTEYHPATSAGERLLAIPAHVARVEDVDNLMDRTIQEFGRLDGLINNVGMNIVTNVVDADPSLWQKIIDTNLNGVFLCSRKAGQLMREQKHGKIVNISSLAASRSAPAMGIYGIAKAGIEMMTKVLAQELALFNIQVNAVAPGMVRTAFSEPFWSNEDFYQLIVKTIPMGRIAEPEDVAHPVLFLCSDGAGFITGQTIGVDGGASAI